MHPDPRLVPLVPMACQLDFIRVPYLEPLHLDLGVLNCVRVPRAGSGRVT